MRFVTRDSSPSGAVARQKASWKPRTFWRTCLVVRSPISRMRGLMPAIGSAQVSGAGSMARARRWRGTPPTSWDVQSKIRIRVSKYQALGWFGVQVSSMCKLRGLRLCSGVVAVGGGVIYLAPSRTASVKWASKQVCNFPPLTQFYFR